MTNRDKRIRDFAKFDDDQTRPPKWCGGYETNIKLTTGQIEEIRKYVDEVSKSNERYLATHQQVLLLVSTILYHVMKHKPLDPRAFIKKILKSDNLKYYMNCHAVKYGYCKTIEQLKEEDKYKEATARVLISTKKEVEWMRSPVENGNICLTPFGPPMKPVRARKSKSLEFTLPHGLIPSDDLSSPDQHRQPGQWPTLFVD